MRTTKMKKLVLIILMGVLVMSTMAFAEEEEEKTFPWTLDFYGGINTPTRLELKDVAETGWNLGYGVGYRINESWLTRLSLGFHKFTEKNNMQVTYVPLQLGVTYFYGIGETTSVYVGTRGGSYFGADSIRSTDFGFAPFVGVAFERDSGSQWFVEPRYNFLFNETVYTEYFGINVGYRPKLQ